MATSAEIAAIIRGGADLMHVAGMRKTAAELYQIATLVANSPGPYGISKPSRGASCNVKGTAPA